MDTSVGSLFSHILECSLVDKLYDIQRKKKQKKNNIQSPIPIYKLKSNFLLCRLFFLSDTITVMSEI